VKRVRWSLVFAIMAWVFFAGSFAVPMGAFWVTLLCEVGVLVAMIGALCAGAREVRRERSSSLAWAYVLMALLVAALICLLAVVF